ncbi:MAG: HopJ type III effector protein [Cyclobacteriaceae bacterium]
MNDFISSLTNDSKSIVFNDTMSVIEANYLFNPTAFKNGDIENKAGENSGSCKLFYFAKLNELSKQQTLNCFAEHYQNVLDTPKGDNHQNIRNFMQYGWDGISFQGEALQLK